MEEFDKEQITTWKAQVAEMREKLFRNKDGRITRMIKKMREAKDEV